MDLQNGPDHAADGLHLVADHVARALIGPGRPGLALLRLEEEEVPGHHDQDEGSR